MQRDRWQQLIIAGVVVALVLAVVAIGLGADALHKSKATTPAGQDGGPVTTILVPRTGQVVSGTVDLSAVGVSSTVSAVDFVATGGPLDNTKIATGVNSIAGWISEWNSTTVTNGTYRIVSIGYSHKGRALRSPDIVVKVVNF